MSKQLVAAGRRGRIYKRGESNLLSLSQVQEHLGVSRWQVYELVRKCELRSVHIGRRHLVIQSDLDIYVKQLREQSDHRASDD